MSGVATATRAMVLAVGSAPTRILDTRKTLPGLVVGPPRRADDAQRVLDKMAVRIGGGLNHRMGLYDMVMIKVGVLVRPASHSTSHQDNHVTAAGGIVPAVEAVRSFLKNKGLSVPVEVETRTLPEVAQGGCIPILSRASTACLTVSDTALDCVESGGVQRIMLDNMVSVEDDGRHHTVNTTMLQEAVQLVQVVQALGFSNLKRPLSSLGDVPIHHFVWRPKLPAT